MTFTEFLAALAQALEDSTGLSSGPAASSLEPIPRVSYDPTRREATAPDEMLIGVGHWRRDQQPIEHRGVCLNNKGTADRFALPIAMPP